MLRGETSITALGRDWPLRFGFRMIMAIEQRTGANYMAFVRQLFPSVKPEDSGDAAKLAEAAAAIPFTNIAVALWGALRGGGNEVNDETLADIVDEIGINRVAEIVAPGIIASVAQEAGDEAAPNPPKAKKPAKPTS